MSSVFYRMILLLNFFIPLLIVVLTGPYFINKLSKRGFVVKDYHKKKLTMVPTYGGLLILLTSLFSISFISLFFKFSVQNYVALLIITCFGLFGLIDDMVDVGQLCKLCLMYYFAYPLIQYVPYPLILYSGNAFIPLGALILQFIVPSYVLVASNLINMHAGFNGLASGLSILILSSLIVKSILLNDTENIVVIISFTGALAGYYVYERYPSSIFWGNIGSLATGAAIGAIIVIQGFLISGFIMLLPHTINFLMYVYWKWKKLPDVEFARVRSDETLDVPNRLTLKWFLPYYYNVTEKQATYAMFLLTSVFCAIGILIPGRL